MVLETQDDYWDRKIIERVPDPGRGSRLHPYASSSGGSIIRVLCREIAGEEEGSSTVKVRRLWRRVTAISRITYQDAKFLSLSRRVMQK